MSFSNAVGRVQVGPGSLYWAPLGTAEPISVSGAWPGGWSSVGYTVGGSTFSFAPTWTGVFVEEELLPLSNIATSATATLTFAMSELTKTNLLLALNASSATADTTATTSDGSLIVNPPTLGLESRIMLGWDYAPKGATPTATTAIERLIIRQAISTGTIAPARVKGATQATYGATFTAEIPGIPGTTGNGRLTAPFFVIKQATLAA